MLLVPWTILLFAYWIVNWTRKRGEWPKKMRSRRFLRFLSKTKMPMGGLLVLPLILVNLLIAGARKVEFWQTSHLKSQLGNGAVSQISLGELSTDMLPDENHIVEIPLETALVRARESLGSGGKRRGSYLEVNRLFIQEVKGRQWWVGPPNFQDKQAWVANKYPDGYFRVPAEDRNQKAEFVTEDLSDEPIEIRYLDGGLFTQTCRIISTNLGFDSLSSSTSLLRPTKTGSLGGLLPAQTLAG